MNTEGKMTINQIKEKLKSKDYDFLKKYQPKIPLALADGMNGEM